MGRDENRVPLFVYNSSSFYSRLIRLIDLLKFNRRVVAKFAYIVPKLRYQFNDDGF